MKKLLSVLLCVAMVFGLLASVTYAAESDEIVITATEFSSITDNTDLWWKTGDGNLGIHVTTTVGYKVNVAKAGTYKLSLNYVSEYRMAKFDVSVNGVKVVDSSVTSFPQQKLAYQDLCVVELKAGENLIELTNIGVDGKALFLNEFVLVPAIAISAPEFSTISDNTDLWWKTADGNLGIHVTATAGYKFNVEVPGTYTLALKYASQYRNAKFEVKVNGEQVVSSEATYPQQALGYQTLCDVKLNAGENVIELTNIGVDGKALFLNEFTLSLVEADVVEPPVDTGDAIGVVVALLAVSGTALVILKKKEF